MDYQSLSDQIKAYANRDDVFFTRSIPDFINQGINRIYYQAKDLGFQKEITAPLSINSVTKPNDWRETISLSLYNISYGQFIQLKPRSYEFVRLMGSYEAGVPEFYADADYTTIRITPYLETYANWNYSLVYLALPLFNDENSENFLTERYPNLLLYSCLMEIVPYLKDDSRINTIKEFYSEALESVNNNARKNKTDRTIDRDIN